MGLLKRILGVKISKDEFAEEMLDLQDIWANNWFNFFEENLMINENNDPEIGGAVVVESHILSLFIISVSVQDESILDLIHNKYLGRHRPLAGLVKEILPVRYEGYYEAFNAFANNPKNGALLSRQILTNMSNILGGNENFALHRIVEEHKIFSQFMNMFKATLNAVEDVKKKQGIEGL